jgi:PAS domain S-box-containing protein
VAQPKLTPTSNVKVRPRILGDVNNLSREAIEALPVGPYQAWLGTVGLAVAVGIAYFIAARFGLALRANTGTSVFWPAAGISVGALIVWGPTARVPVSAGVVVAAAVSNLMIGRNAWLAVAFGFVNAGQALLATGLIERWLKRSLNFGDVSNVLGFLVASTIGSAVAAIGATIAVGLIESTGSLFTVWRVWFASCLLGIVTVAPLVVGIAEAGCQRPARRELLEGAVAVAMLVALSVLAISLPQGPWSTALPVGLVFPVLLWVALRCRPAFSAAAGFVVALTVVWSLTFGIGHFGDASVALADRMLAAQTIVLTTAVLTLVVAALFADKRRSEAALHKSNERLQLALEGAELGAFSADLATGRFECDAQTAQSHGHDVPPMTIKESRRFVHSDDRVRIDAALTEAKRRGGRWNAEYRVLPPPGHPHAGETRWIAVDSSIVRDPRGTPVELLGVTRDITECKRAKQAFALAARTGLIGTYAYDAGYDTDIEKVQISPGCAAIHGLPEGTSEITRKEWLARVHPEDVERLQVLRNQAFHQRRREYSADYRIVRAGEVRWIELRVFISYNSDGHPQRVIGVNIDVTDRKRSEALLSESKDRLAERNLQLALAGRAVRVGSYTYEVNTGKMQISEGYAAIHDLPEGTTETSYSEWQARVHPEDLVRAEECRNQAFGGGQKEDNAEYRIVLSTGEIRWIERRGSISYGEDGRPERIVGVNIDITERKQAEEHRNILNAELDHRVKNVLATVCAIIFQSQRTNVSAADFVASVERRIKSLASTHDLMRYGRWRGVSLAEIIRREFAPYTTGNTQISGPSITLKPEAAQATAMVLHELATNAAKYGALSNHSGRVSVWWFWMPNGIAHHWLAIEWQETDGPPVSAPSACGYGTSIIRELIPHELGGTVDLAFAPGGVRCRLQVPADWISSSAREPGAMRETV